MFNKKRLNFLLMIFFLFAVLIGNSGCGGGSSSSRYYVPAITSDDIISPDIPITSPDLPVTSPDVPVVSPDIPKTSPDVPIVSPDIPRVSPDIPVISPDVPKISPDVPVVSPDVPDNPITSPDVPETPVGRNYIVTFNSNGGSSISRQNVQPNGTVTMPENSTKENYIFAGWFKDKNFTEMFLFGEDGDKITSNITLYARWIENNPTLFRVEYAINAISIGYSRGDNPNYVTNDVELPTAVKTFDDVFVFVNWSSNSNAISSTGKVTRPTQTDENVILTARVAAGNESKTREFNLKVIHKNSRVSSDIPVIDIQDAGSADLIIEHDSNDQIAYIEGKYSNLKIENADDALDAIQSIHNSLGINNPYEELEPSVITSNNYGSEYSFQQVYNGVKVYGRSITASANENGEADFFSSSFLASDVLANANMNTSLTKKQAEDIALNACKEYDIQGSFDVNSDSTELIVYAIGNYESNPVYAYVVRVYGTDSADNYIDGKIFVNSSNNVILDTDTNLIEISSRFSSFNELGERVYFNAEFENSDGLFYLNDVEKKLTVRHSDNTGNFETVPVDTADGSDISAYTNMLKILDWWNTSFDRNSLDNRGLTIAIINHFGKKNNASWKHESKNGIGIFYIGNYETPMTHSYAATLDILAHEATHAVLEYEIASDFPYKNITGAINEGYADIFGCLKEQNWQVGEKAYEGSSKYSYLRNIANPGDDRAKERGPERLFGENYIDYTIFFNNPDLIMGNIYGVDNTDHGGVHSNCLMISHAAYLMHEDATPGGLSWEQLGQVWYNSMRLGNYGATSDWYSVRWAVITAAKKMHLPTSQIEVIQNAFNQVGIEAKTLNLRGSVLDYDTGNVISGAKVTVFEDDIVQYVLANATTQVNGRFSIKLDDPGRYPIRIEKEGYVPFLIFETIPESGDLIINVKLVKSGSASLSGTIYDSKTHTPISGVRLNIRSGWNVETGDTVAEMLTESNGTYSTPMVAGYYTVEMIKDGYETSTFNVTVSGTLTNQNGYLEPNGSGGNTAEDVPIDEAHFPDENFRRYVKRFDTNQDGIFNTSEIEKVTSINANHITISDLKGVEFFTALQNLYCEGNQLTTLDVSKNTALQTLDCEYGQIRTLDVSGCSALQTLKCRHNQLTTLDISNCSALQTLECYGNQLTTLDVSKNIALQNLYCSNNQLKELDVSKNIALQNLYCTDNQLKELDVSKNIALQNLHCSNNQLTTLDVSKNIALQNLYCHYNQLTTLDVSKNIALQNLYCQNNQLITLRLPHLLYVFYHDDNVNIIIANNTSTAKPSSVTNAQEISSFDDDEINEKIVAILPEVTATEKGIYDFEVSFDEVVRAGTKLFVRVNSEDVNNYEFYDENAQEITMPLEKDFDGLTVSMKFEADKKYSPVIIASSSSENENNNSSSGGCNSIALGGLTLIAFVILLKKR